jgi:hypothetical protein
MTTPSPVSISDDLVIQIGAATAHLTPSQGFATAEVLLRKSARRAIFQEAEDICGPDFSTSEASR